MYDSLCTLPVHAFSSACKSYARLEEQLRQAREGGAECREGECAGGGRWRGERASEQKPESTESPTWGGDIINSVTYEEQKESD